MIADPLPDERLRDDIATVVFTQTLIQSVGIGDLPDKERQDVLESVACISYEAAQAFINVRQALARNRR